MGFPIWMQWFQGIALIAIPIIGALIAYQQVQIAGAKLKLDLFDKRFALFEAARKTLILVLQHGDIQVNDLNRYHISILDAAFLFDEGMETYLENLGKSCWKLHNLKEATPGDEKERVGEEMLKLHNELSRELPIFKSKFMPYLKLGVTQSWIEQVNIKRFRKR